MTFRTQGDDSYVWFEDPCGFSVVMDRGQFVYAKVDKTGALVPTTLVVGRDNPADAGLVKKARPNETFIKKQGQKLFKVPATVGIE